MSYKEIVEVACWIAEHNNGAVGGDISIIEHGIDLDKSSIKDVYIFLYDIPEEGVFNLPPLFRNIKTSLYNSSYVITKATYQGVTFHFKVNRDAVSSADDYWLMPDRTCKDVKGYFINLQQIAQSYIYQAEHSKKDEVINMLADKVEKIFEYINNNEDYLMIKDIETLSFSNILNGWFTGEPS